MSSALSVQVDRIRRRKWVVASIVVIFLIGGVVAVLTSQATYSTKAALGTVSQTRSPQQDATLAQGYVNFFNDPAYQATLRQRAGVPDGVTFEAETAADSPLIYITATSSREVDVRLAASKMATALLDTVNDALRASRDQAIAAVRKPFDKIRAANGVVPEQALIQMDDRISELNADTTNQLAVLQLESGVSSTSPSVVRAIGLALFAGVVAGCAVALTMGALTRRVDSAIDLTEKTGIPVLAVVPNADAGPRPQRYGQLANALGRCDASALDVLVVASVRELAATVPAAWGVAAHRAAQGRRVVVLDADLRTPGSGPGLAEYLSATDTIAADELIRPSTQHPGVFELSRGADVASVRAVDIERFEKLLAKLRERADLVIVIAPSIVETAEAQVVCAAADTTLLVVERSVTMTGDVNEAKRLIMQVDGGIAGAVLIDKGVGSSGRSAWTARSAANTAQAPSSAAPPTRALPRASGSVRARRARSLTVTDRDAPKVATRHPKPGEPERVMEELSARPEAKLN